MNDNYIYLSGTPTSYQSEITELLSGDMFLISQPIHNYMNREFTSNHLTYNTLSSNIHKHYLRTYGEEGLLVFGSMAYELSEDWSKIVHHHNYTSVIVKSNYDNQVSNELFATVYISADNNVKTQIPLYHPKLKPSYQIGELKFVAWPRLKPIDTDNISPDFDGWVYPDGRLLSKSRFSKAYNYFLNSYGDETDTHFRIPDIHQFIKAPAYSSDANRLITQQNQTNVLKNHYHNINNVHFNQTLTASLSVLSVAVNEDGGRWDRSDPEKDNYVSHFIISAYENTTSGKQRYQDIPLLISADIQIKQVHSSEILDAVDDSETYPKYNDIPVLMYVGGVE